MDVQELIDREQIRDVINRLSRGMDRLDESLLRGSYHPGAFDRHGATDGLAEDFVNQFLANNRLTALWHGINNVLIDFHGNDAAQAESYVTAYCYQRDGSEPRGNLITYVGRYRDRLERRDDEWRITERVVILDWSEQRPIVESDIADKFVSGRRDSSDPTYQSL
ncbi:nuclear transport factor 2 family protein [Actinomadura sp. LD22]|uniref:Nuclear transport factor 2 family protein n=1 Tax=Actinomadura physcomitrii TaxID=2650748 RepID=A0A6I4MJT9_9ACTN|nr:nuclear transport factor 2 family protein [Actinomadura physcomitrii]MWA04835.1 nuclear transport factor 2 family protein [Actinomadura physcomitrii]